MFCKQRFVWRNRKRTSLDTSVNSWISSNNNYEIIEIYPSTSIKESTNTTYRTDFLYSVTIIYRLK